MSKQMVCTDAVLGYEGVAVAEGISFSVSEGDYLCILGENGSGKSTLIKALLGLKSVMSGEIEYVNGFSSKEIGYLPQQTPVQRDFPASVREIVQSGCLGRCAMRPFYSKEDKARCNEALEQLGIGELAWRCYRELSGGQQQRVLLARALCAANKMLLLDEPVSGLDPKAQLEMYELISELNKKGITIIMVSHDIGMSVRYATHILHIGSKKQLFFGETNDYINSVTGRSFIGSKGGDEIG